MLVLIADDDPSTRRALRIFVESEGHQVVEADSGETAMEQLLAHPVELALLDWDLRSGVNGLEAARYAPPGCAVFIVSGYTMESIRGPQEDPLKGVLAFVAKPVDWEKPVTGLRDLIRRVVRSQRTTTPPPPPDKDGE